MAQKWYQKLTIPAAIKKPSILAAIIGGVLLIIAWIIGGLDAYLKGLSGAFGVGSGIAVIVWLTRTFLEQKLRAAYEREKLEIAHKQKIVETMVVQLHDFTRAYYMPMITAVGAFASYLKAGNPDYAFHGLGEYVLAHKEMRAQIHGYFLQDLVAERVIETLSVAFWHEHVLGNGFLKPGEGYLVGKALEVDMSPEEFVGKVRGNSRLNEIYEGFRNTAQDDGKKRKVILVAETFEQVFQLEVNLPYKAWYGRVPSHIGEENLSLLEKQKDKLKQKQLTDEDIDKYLEKIRQFKV